jgi:hypothetical protein
MKKKIINGILMVALVGATSTSFVSCKDTSEDVKTDLMAQINAAKANLEPRVEKAESDITKLQGDVTGLKSDIAGIRDTLNSLEDFRDSVYVVTQRLDKRMNTVEERINAIVNSLRNMVTSVNVNATSTNILQNSKLFPGLDIQFLGAAYGQAEGNGKFPSTTTLKGHGTALDASDFEAADQIEWSKNDFLPLAEEGKASAGTVYFTVNPSNVDVTALNDLKLFSYVDGKNVESFVTIDKDAAKVAEGSLTWGITRSTAEEDGNTFEAKVWEAPAIINLKANDLATIDPTEIIDFKAVASDVRSMLSEVKTAAEDANRNNYKDLAKTTTKSVLKNSAQIVGSLLSAKLPSLPALALAAQWKDTVGVRSVLSDYSIAATAYKPLGFGFGADLVDGRTVNFDKLDNAFARIINKIVAKIPANFNEVEFAFNFPTTVGATVYTLIETGAGGAIKSITISSTLPAAYNTVLPATPAADTKYHTSGTVNSDIRTVTDAIEAGINLTQINSMINEVNKLITDAKSYADRSKSFEVRVSDFLERELNRVITKVATDGLTRVLEPIILFQAGDNFNVTRFVEGETIPAGKITLVPTTMTYEVLAPAYKKYVAIKNTKTGKFAYKKVLTKGDADFSKVVIDNLEAGNYTVIYSALDFSGVQISKKYNITVK